jgi:MoaA/NifB/PqqE/SkfB family radical SAM enzyme
MPDIAYVDTIDVCHLKCPSCIRGVRTIANTPRKMRLDLFESIVAKLKAANYRKISLYNWTEPFLNRTLEDYVRIIKAAGLVSEISTTLSLRHIDNLEATLVAGIDHIIVSISGARQEVYEINHVGGNLQYVESNLERARAFIDKHHLATRVFVRMLRFEYNMGEEPGLRQLADRYRFEFAMLEGMSDPTSRPAEKVGESYYEEILSHSGPSEAPETQGKVCPLMFDQIVIDCLGDVHICCAFPTLAPLRIGAYLDLPDAEILLRRYVHPLCRVCYMPRRPSTPDDGERLKEAIGERLALHGAAEKTTRRLAIVSS